jgi:hypothetical protein
MTRIGKAYATYRDVPQFPKFTRKGIVLELFLQNSHFGFLKTLEIVDPEAACSPDFASSGAKDPRTHLQKKPPDYAVIWTRIKSAGGGQRLILGAYDIS